MARKSYLLRREERWYYNRAFPKELWPLVGRKPFRIALGTSSLEEAQRLRGLAEQRYWAAVDEARAKVAKHQPRRLTEIEAISLVVRWFRQAVESGPEMVLAVSKSPDDLDHHLAMIDEAEVEARQAVAERDVSTVRAEVESLLRREGYAVDRKSPAYTPMLLAMLRARREALLGQRARLLGRYDWHPADPLFSGALAQGETEQALQHTIGDLIREYQASKEQKRRWSQSTITAHKPVYRLLRETFGETRELRTIGREDGRHLFNMIVGMPMNLGKTKELKGLTVPQAVAKARALGLPTIGPKTINGSYVTFVKAMFKWAVTEGWMDRNPLDGDFRVADDVAEHEKRDAFQPDQLRVLFSASPWDGSYDRMGPKAGKFWIPLLCLFHGLRLGEAAGMHVEDVTEREGHPVFHLRAFDGRSSKTKGSRGILPIHPELIRMGFLAYVEQRRRTKAIGLFPDVATSKNGKVGAKTGEWFARLVRERGLVGTKLTMHSFRHSFEDRLREDEVPERTALALSRRTERGSRGVYGDGLSVASRARWMAKLAHPGLDLGHLHLGEADREAAE
ncbi:hypothetical protein CA233_12590 [Sphingomonas sp. ABOLD]|uniref:Integrase n=1 Tax=Sphingomonas trueperi TaxID=53317 RepID=A0A7X5XZ34_9SPHN|nr:MULTISPECIES: site-specific integrase [Sphingomonas]NJB98032.1 integrase [Sphingomonas trueperi]RSV46326.1 hypothetical protein CA233_12590 [Sphingomonas sp. ABOLD]